MHLILVQLHLLIIAVPGTVQELLLLPSLNVSKNINY